MTRKFIAQIYIRTYHYSKLKWRNLYRQKVSLHKSLWEPRFGHTLNVQSKTTTPMLATPANSMHANANVNVDFWLIWWIGKTIIDFNDAVSLDSEYSRFGSMAKKIRNSLHWIRYKNGEENTETEKKSRTVAVVGEKEWSGTEKKKLDGMRGERTAKNWIGNEMLKKNGWMQMPKFVAQKIWIVCTRCNSEHITI